MSNIAIIKQIIM